MTKEERNTCITRIITGVVFLVACVFVYYQATLVRPQPYEPLGPVFLPKAVCVCMILISIALIAMNAIPLLRAPASAEVAEKAPAEEEYRRHPVYPVFIVLTFLSYIYSMHSRVLGYLPATMCFIGVLSFLLVRIEKKPIRAGHIVAIVVLMTVLSYGLTHIFTNVFFVKLP